VSNVPTRPLLRYFGGKWQLRHWIIKHLPPHKFYAEPFAGAASVLLAKPPAPGGEIINDLNREMINLFRVMQCREAANELERRLEWTPYARAELSIAALPSDDPVERARRMLIRSFMGIEGSGLVGRVSGFRMGSVDLRRLDQDGKRTFRNCAHDWTSWKGAIGLIRDRLSTVMIYERDALEFIAMMDSQECLLYVDPPYHHEARSGTRYAVEFSGHAELVTLLVKASSMVVLSGYECSEYTPLQEAGWRVVRKDYRANMSLRRRTECLWISPSAQLATKPNERMAA
jgi:DNA adenine methylase